ncbi:hypothetical protein BH23GEM11_BH23GEM11_11120 [soil metagenome]
MLAVLVFVLVFARWNGSERMTLDLGLWTFYRVPMTWVVFASFLLGMLVMLLAGLHADLRVRRFLRGRFTAGDDDLRHSREDRLQQDLFRLGHPEDDNPPIDPPA